MIKNKVRDRFTGAVIFEYEGELRHQDLRGRNLSGARLYEAYLSGADLSRADLSRADLREADLSRADLSRADLREADLSRAYLSRTRLFGANLSRADFYKAELFEVDLSEANLDDSILDPKRYLPPLFILWNNACSQKKNALVIALETKKVLRNTWQQGTEFCPEGYLLGSKGAMDVFTMAWDTSAISHQILLNHLKQHDPQFFVNN